MSSAPYLTSSQLTLWPLGVSWATVGMLSQTTPSQYNQAALSSICRLASNQVDSECGQTLRSMFITEPIRGPSHRLGFLPGNSTARLLTSWHPIRKIVGAAVAPTSQVPKTFTMVPSNAIWQESPPQGFYGTTTNEPYHGGNNSILCSSSYVSWTYGHYGTEVWVSYLNGWPHASLSVDAPAGSTTVTVDDVTGMVGSAPTFFDGADTEPTLVVGSSMDAAPAWSDQTTYAPGQTVTYNSAVYQVMIPSGPATNFGPQTPGSASAYWGVTPEPTGPGTLNLSAPTAYAHAAGTLLSAVPDDVIWACALYAKADALQRGLATVSLPGREGKAVSTEQAISDAIREAVAHLTVFRRII